MILVARQPFGVSRYHQLTNPEMASSALARGPVLHLTLRFERWMDGRPLEADAFVDPGADQTILSLRWIQEQGGQGRHQTPRYALQRPGDLDSGLLDEAAAVQIAGQSLALGTTQVVRVMEQPPGFEDILLGRDFLSAHQMLLVLDGKDETFSLLLPADHDNQRKRERILKEISTD